MKTKKSKMAIGIGAAVGVVAGIATGILTASKSGKETRADIKNKATALKNEANKDIKIVSEKADKIVGEAKVIAKEVIAEVELNAADLKERTDCAIKAAKKGFIEKK